MLSKGGPEAKASLRLLRPCKGSLVLRKGLLKKLPAPRTQILHQDDRDARRRRTGNIQPCIWKPEAFTGEQAAPSVLIGAKG